MQTNIHPDLKHLPEVQKADEILRSCVHCGFCTAVCPTYQELGDDLDSPRGRIYLIKNLLEENSLGETTHEHLDRCLTCRSCETTCPSGVEYGQLLDISKNLMQTRLSPRRPLLKRWLVFGLRQLLPRPGLFSFLYQCGWLLRPILPRYFKDKMPEVHYKAHHAKTTPSMQTPQASAAKQVLLLNGCVQRSLTPGVNQAIESLLGAEGYVVQYLSGEGCCGAVDYHLGHHEAGLDRMRALIDRVYEQLDDVDWIISSASGCGVTLKDYPELLASDEIYGPRAQAIVLKLRDVSEVVNGDRHPCGNVSVAIHTPCTLQHGQQLPNQLKKVLTAAGANLVTTKEPHLCCGSAGTYSVLEADMAKQLGTRKVKALTEQDPDVIVTANVGCQTHLSSLAGTRVMHWAEFLALYRQT